MQKNSKIYFLVFVIILITGISMRASIFFKNPALWIDEALTANKLIHSPIKSLVMPDAAAQEMTMHAYPFGFLALSQFVIILFGLTEMTLRLIPFLSGIMALFIFRRIPSIYLIPHGICGPSPCLQYAIRLFFIRSNSNLIQAMFSSVSV